MSFNFNAHHSPCGAFASLTLGMRGKNGGLGLELGAPACQNLFIGVESAPDHFEMLPFWDGAENSGGADFDDAARYQVEGSVVEDHRQHLRPVTLRPLNENSLSRDFRLSSDSFAARDWSFTIYSPIHPLPDPQSQSLERLQTAITPALWCEFLVNNSGNDFARRAVFGFTGNDPYSNMRRLNEEEKWGFAGVGQGRYLAIVSQNEGVQSALGFSAEDILGEPNRENWTFGLGGTGLLVAEVPAGEIVRLQFAVCFHRDALVTANEPMRYFYNRFFPDIETVAQRALFAFDDAKEQALKNDAEILDADLSGDQKWQICHAIRAYFGSTQLLENQGGEPVWVVNEGEYRMMNTFDLTVDHLFYEMRQNPWVVKNALDRFVARYSYQDQCGISFTHDQGVANVWSRPHFSAYEKYGLHGCFSHMTHEQLVNWVLCAAVYGQHDKEWRDAQKPIFEACLQSLLNRDSSDDSKRRGVMQIDSDRCRGGSEITTYDSLDVSLGQARNNGYLALKTWASYLALEEILPEHAEICATQARRGADTILSMVGEDGTIPAVFENDNQSRIIPAIEGLVFPYFTGRKEVLKPDGPFGDLLAALKTHLEGVLQIGVCLFPDYGWKLSSTSENSWLSKIYLCQWVAREILGVKTDFDDDADRAHVGWLLDPRNIFWSWSDQMVAGHAQGSKYYPRGVTSILWLGEGANG